MRRLAIVALTALAACARPAVRPVPFPPTPVTTERVPAPPPLRHPPSAAIVFLADGFPTADGGAADVVAAALPGALVATTTDALEVQLHAHPFDTLVLPYGSAFPVDAWPAIRAFLRGGGGLVVLGGAPFQVPIYRRDGAWVSGAATPAFANELLVGPAERLTMPDGTATWALTLRLTREKDFADEHGSAGPTDAVARPLETVTDATGTPRGCTLLEIDRVRGPEAGARWTFATTNRHLAAEQVRAIVARAMQGAVDTRAVPERATVAPGAKAAIDVAATGRFTMTVSDASGQSIWREERAGSGVVTVPTRGTGLHRVVVERADGPEPRRVETGFWVRDASLLRNGPRLGVSRDWLTKDGKPFPVVGTTYMASDVHRHFLFEPNPVIWDRDFAEMQRRGINFVRTGLWTAWSRVMKDGVVDDAVLDAAEAFVASAARHGIVVCFNLFAFLPPNYGGTNPYLDSRSISGQTHLATAFASRFRDVSWIHWDLINEPSYAPREKLWRTRPIGDTTEAAAWRKWLDERHRHPSTGELAALYDDAGDPWAIPVDADFEVTAVQVGRHPRKARDFRELSESAVATWAATMRDAIRGAAGSQTLVTLGQDEGGIYERATQQFLAPSLDYTAVHTWWKNDDLLWDGVLTKVVGKPSLHQETGLMRLETADGRPWRTPENAARLLERKLGYAFAARGAGVVEWVWNINPYMPIDEETTIGLFRPDGTAKPELDALERFARFFGEAAPYVGDFEPDSVVVLVPHARAFLGRPGLIDATKPVVRTLAERFGVVPAAVSDLRVETADLAKAKLVIVPSPSVLDARAANALAEAARRGTKVLITGALEGDSYGRPLQALPVDESRPVAMREKTHWSPTGDVAFEDLAQETVRRAVGAEAPLTGNLWREPLPLELARDREPLARLLEAALREAHVAPGFSGTPADAGVAGRVLLTPRYALVVLVNERADAATRSFAIDGRATKLEVGALGATAAIVDRATGKVLAQTR